MNPEADDRGEELDAAIGLMQALHAAGRSYKYIAEIMTGDGFKVTPRGVAEILARAQPN